MNKRLISAVMIGAFLAVGSLATAEDAPKKKMTREDLIRLKQEKPEVFKKLVAESQRRQKLQQLQESNPEAYKKLMERRAAMEKWTRENPGKTPPWAQSAEKVPAKAENAAEKPMKKKKKFRWPWQKK